MRYRLVDLSKVSVASIVSILLHNKHQIDLFYEMLPTKEEAICSMIREYVISDRESIKLISEFESDFNINKGDTYDGKEINEIKVNKDGKSVNLYWDSGHTEVINPDSDDIERIIDEVEKNRYKPNFTVETHRLFKKEKKSLIKKVLDKVK